MQAPSVAPNGFSIVEALVALSIVALLAGLASESIRYATRTRTTIVSMSSRYEENETIRRVLERSVSAIWHGDDERQSASSYFHGTHTELSFVAPLPDSAYHGAPGEFHLTLRRNGGWVLTWRIAANSASVERYGGVTILADSVSEVAIDYFGPVSENQSDWVPTWDRKETPQSIRFRWLRGVETQQFAVRVFTAKAECFRSNVVFVRQCLE